VTKIKEILNKRYSPLKMMHNSSQEERHILLSLQKHCTCKHQNFQATQCLLGCSTDRDEIIWLLLSLLFTISPLCYFSILFSFLLTFSSKSVNEKSSETSRAFAFPLTHLDDDGELSHSSECLLDGDKVEDEVPVLEGVVQKSLLFAN
jgi:hypothetical protein